MARPHRAGRRHRGNVRVPGQQPAHPRAARHNLPRPSIPAVGADDLAVQGCVERRAAGVAGAARGGAGVRRTATVRAARLPQVRRRPRLGSGDRPHGGDRAVHGAVHRHAANGSLRTTPNGAMGARSAPWRARLGRTRRDRRRGLQATSTGRLAAAVVGRRAAYRCSPSLRGEVPPLRRARAAGDGAAGEPVGRSRVRTRRRAPTVAGRHQGGHRARGRGDDLLRAGVREHLLARPPRGAGVGVGERQRRARSRHSHGQPLGRGVRRPWWLPCHAAADVRGRQPCESRPHLRDARGRRLRHGLQQPSVGQHRAAPRALSLQQRLLPRPVRRQPRLRARAGLRPLPQPARRLVRARPLHARGRPAARRHPRRRADAGRAKPRLRRRKRGQLRPPPYARVAEHRTPLRRRDKRNHARLRRPRRARYAERRRLRPPDRRRHVDGYLRRGGPQRMASLARVARCRRGGLPGDASPLRAAAAPASRPGNRAGASARPAARRVARVAGSERRRVDVLARERGMGHRHRRGGLRRPAVPEPSPARRGPPQLALPCEHGGPVHCGLPRLRAHTSRQPRPVASLARRREADGPHVPHRRREVDHVPSLRPLVRRRLHQLLLLRFRRRRLAHAPDRHRAGGRLQPGRAAPVRAHPHGRLQRWLQPGGGAAPSRSDFHASGGRLRRNGRPGLVRPQPQPHCRRGRSRTARGRARQRRRRRPTAAGRP